MKQVGIRHLTLLVAALLSTVLAVKSTEGSPATPAPHTPEQTQKTAPQPSLSSTSSAPGVTTLTSDVPKSVVSVTSHATSTNASQPGVIDSGVNKTHAVLVTTRSQLPESNTLPQESQTSHSHPALRDRSTVSSNTILSAQHRETSTASATPGPKSSSSESANTTVNTSMPYSEQDSGRSSNQDQTNTETVTGSDKKALWSLLPIVVSLVVGVVLGAIAKLRGNRSHTDQLDTGMENASFQSRPESSRDGVMLLGVKSSVEESSAGAR